MSSRFAASDSTSASAEPAEYRPLSGRAILAVILACCSPLAIVHIVLWAIPLAAIVTAALAQRPIREGARSGAGLARWSHLLACFFLALAVVRLVTADRIVSARAQDAAEAWMELVCQGRLDEAHQCTVSPLMRVEKLELIPAFYREDQEARQERDQLFHRPYLRDFVALGDKAVVTLVRQDKFTEGRLGQNYRFTFRYDPARPEAELQITVSRRWYSDTRGYEWEVDPVDPDR